MDRVEKTSSSWLSCFCCYWGSNDNSHERDPLVNKEHRRPSASYSSVNNREEEDQGTTTPGQSPVKAQSVHEDRLLNTPEYV